MKLTLVPDSGPLPEQLRPLIATAASRLALDARLVAVELVADAMVADDRAWLRLSPEPDGLHLTIWYHPDQVLPDRLGHGVVRDMAADWRLGPVPADEPSDLSAEISVPNAQRFVYQQLLLVDDLIAGRLVPGEVPPSLSEAFQECWLVTVDGRLQRLGLPHRSAAERRASFLRLFAPAGVLTPGHWTIFNGFWDGSLASQSEVLAKVRLLPALAARRTP